MSRFFNSCIFQGLSIIERIYGKKRIFVTVCDSLQQKVDESLKGDVVLYGDFMEKWETCDFIFSAEVKEGHGVPSGTIEESESLSVRWSHFAIWTSVFRWHFMNSAYCVEWRLSKLTLAQLNIFAWMLLFFCTCWILSCNVFLMLCHFYKVVSGWQFGVYFHSTWFHV